LNSLLQGAKDPDPLVRIAAGRALRALNRMGIPSIPLSADPSVQALLTSVAVVAPFWAPGKEFSSPSFASPSSSDLLRIARGMQGADPWISWLVSTLSTRGVLNWTVVPDSVALEEIPAASWVESLLNLYLALLDESVRDRQSWLTRFGSVQPLTPEGLSADDHALLALRSSRAIAWVLSRAPLESTLHQLTPGITARLPKIRLGTYLLLEDLAALQPFADFPDPGLLRVQSRHIDIKIGSVSQGDRDAVRSFNRDALLPPQINPLPAMAPERAREPGPRFADFQFFRDDEGAVGSLVAADTNLVPDRWYWLEVAIRGKAIGIPDLVEPVAPIRPIRQDAPVRILVVAESKQFELGRAMGWIELPPVGDSAESLPYFKVRVPEAVALRGEAPEIHLRFYYRFNLIEHIVITAEVGRDESPGTAPRLTKHQESIVRDYVDLDEFVPRHMNVHITKEGETFRFRFTVADQSSSGGVVLTAVSELSSLTLEGHILQARAVLEELSLRNYVDPESETKGRVREVMRSVAVLGQALWRALFKSDPSSDLAVIGSALREYTLPENSLVQISMPGLSTGFLYPWALLYDRPLPEESHEIPDPRGFWGYRYAIEQQLGVTTRRPDRAAPCPRPMSVAYMLWDSFPNAADQTRFLQQLVGQCGGSLSVNSPPLTRAKDFFARLRSKEILDSVLYFYTHGVGKRPRTADSVSTFAEGLRVKLASLPTQAPERADLEQFLDRLQGAHAHAQPSIEMTNGRITYLELADSEILFSHGPFVFLNMCESAQLLPLDGENFVALFLRMGARAVLGTECTMTIRFAAPFSERLLNELLRGTMLGEALRRVRQAFLDTRNPLCLAYTLFGSGTLQLSPAPLAVLPATQKGPPHDSPAS
jgi:hypothetical protein